MLKGFADGRTKEVQVASFSCQDKRAYLAETGEVVGWMEKPVSENLAYLRHYTYVLVKAEVHWPFRPANSNKSWDRISGRDFSIIMNLKVLSKIKM